MNDTDVSKNEQAPRLRARPSPGGWLLLAHQIPPTPPYFRVKVRRRLQRIGAVPVKNSLYALPRSDDAMEDFQWLRQEIERDGGEAVICEAQFVDPKTEQRFVDRFRADRRAEYESIAAAASELIGQAAEPSTGPSAAALNQRAAKLERKLEQVIAMDTFDSPGMAAARSALDRLKDSVRPSDVAPGPPGRPGPRPRARTWVTRRGIKIDRIASAWLIRRFIDPAARFKFVEARGYEPSEGELRFDMFEGEYTHVGDACTFETLLQAFDLADPALSTVGEIVHDIDCKDEKFGRSEADGIASLIDGLIRACPDDDTRLGRGAELFDSLYAHFRTAS